MSRRILRFKELRGKGIPFSRQWTDKLIKAGKFPRPVYLSANTKAWREKEIDEFLANLPRERAS